MTAYTIEARRLIAEGDGSREDLTDSATRALEALANVRRATGAPALRHHADALLRLLEWGDHDPRGYAPQGYYDPIKTPEGEIIDHDDPRPPALRLGHCTPAWGGHSPACARDGTYCSQPSTHEGPCTPHGQRR